MKPSDEYSSFLGQVHQKVHLSRTIITFIQNNQEGTYEDMLNHIQTVVPPPGVPVFSEDALLRHAQFIVDQVNFRHPQLGQLSSTTPDCGNITFVQ